LVVYTDTIRETGDNKQFEDMSDELRRLAAQICRVIRFDAALLQDNTFLLSRGPADSLARSH